MTAHYSPLEAYRRDLARMPGRESFGDDDGDWIVLVHAVHRLASTPDAEIDAKLQQFRDSLREQDAASCLLGRLLEGAVPAADPRSAFVAAASSAATQMEDAGALFMAASLFSGLGGMASGGSTLEQGRVSADWARVERQLGHFDVAADLYRQTRRLGVVLRSPELRARAQLGLGVLARIRGNYPEARVHFRAALAIAERAYLATLTGHAHHGLFVVSTVARDFDAAFKHGWAALAHAAGDPPREVDVLVNLAEVCLIVGQNQAALSSALAAARQATVDRSRLPAIATAATAAARLGDLAALATHTASILPHLGDASRPYEVAQLLHSLFTAWTDAGQPGRAETFRERGLAIAREHRFTELMHQFETAPAAVPRAARLSPRARRVVRALGELSASGRGAR